MINPKSLANLDPANLEEPGQAALTHQAVRWQKSGLFPLCRKCILRKKCEVYDEEDEDKTCPLAQEAYDHLIESIRALPQIQPEDLPLVVEYARQSIFVQIIDTWIGEAGPFLPGAEEGFLEPQPVLTGLRYTAAGHIARLSDRLGLNPAARAKLKASGKLAELNPMTAAIIAIDVEDQKEAETDEAD